MLVFIASFSVLAVLTTFAIQAFLRTRRLSTRSCSSLLEGMHYVDMRQICHVARQKDNFIEEEMLEEFLLRLGGVEGLNRLSQNAAAMMDVARYLTLMKPESHDLAHRIRRNASKARRHARVISWRYRLRIGKRSIFRELKELTRLYVEVSVASMQISELLVDEILPLLQNVTNVNAGLRRATEISAS